MRNDVQKKTGEFRLGLVCFYLIIVAFFCVLTPPALAADNRKDWAVHPGLSLEVVADGFLLPVMIAIVPEPGPAPSDPYCYVTELGGTVRVVSNDGSVHVFAKDFFKIETPEDLPEAGGAMGLAGIALDPATGYIFVTFAYDDEEKKKFNNVIRFKTKPGTFALKPESQVMFTDVFRRAKADFIGIPNGHQIGECIVVGDKLFIGVGDGELYARSRDKESLFGKVICLTLDGEPYPDNPFAGEGEAASMVYTLGLRNPFGLAQVDGRVFVSDNGPGVDRVVEAIKGKDFLYDGTGAAIGLNAVAALHPARGMGQMDFLGGDTDFAKAGFGEGFLIARTGPPEVLLDGEHPAITWLGYNPETSWVTSTEQTLVEYLGSEKQCVNAVAYSGNEILFAPLFNNGLPGPVPIYKMRYDPTMQHPEILGTPRTGVEVIKARGCLGCHTYHLTGNPLAAPLDSKILIPSLRKRVGTSEYEKQVAAMSDADGFADARKSVLGASGDERIRRWITEHVIQPRFDTPLSAMPALGVKREEAMMLAEFLVKDFHTRKYIFGTEVSLIINWALIFLGGAVAGAIALILLLFLIRRFQKKVV